MSLKALSRLFKISSSTKACLREARHTPGFGLLDALHGYIYARWPYLYIGIGTGEHRLVGRMRPVLNFLLNILSGLPADRPRIEATGLHPGSPPGVKLARKVTFADTYHGKVLRLDAAKKLVAVKQDIRLTNLEKVIPYPLARNLILKNPARILAVECPCRSARAKPCVPLDVCLVVGEPFVSFILEHYADRSRLIDKDEAIEILVAEAKRGHVHHAFFKEALLGRFFAICNCCSCCCGAMQIQRNGIPMLASSGYVSTVEEDVCNGCGTCEKFCHFNAIAVDNESARVDPAACMGCGVCQSFCPQKAITLKRDPNRAAPLELDELIMEAGGPSQES
ncbi:MAG: 4Fe-4S binding protein [Desulfobacterales bacterium]|jgi:ferredoxin